MADRRFSFPITEQDQEEIVRQIEDEKKRRSFDENLADIVAESVRPFDPLSRREKEQIKRYLVREICKRVNPEIIAVMISANEFAGFETNNPLKHRQNYCNLREERTSKLLQAIIESIYIPETISIRIIRRKVKGCLIVIEEVINSLSLESIDL